MEENTEYKPFASREQSSSNSTGTTKYYNTVKSLTAKKNDCTTGSIGSTVTLTANANQFESTISIADANAQADSWLTTNIQAYANNAGICRVTAWRGINPTCIIEPTTDLLEFNYLVVRYKWALGAGKDFDTFTGFINTGTEWDNKYMGYGHLEGNELPKGTQLAENSYIMWAEDNMEVHGVESCLINFNKMAADYPTLNSIQIRMAGAWFRTVGTGNIDIEIITYLGGVMEKSGFDYINTKGGKKVQEITFSKHIPQPPTWVNDVDAVTNIGYITFTKSSSTGQITITY